MAGTPQHPLHGWRFSCPERQPRNQFFTTQVGNRKAVGFLRFTDIAQPYLAAEPSIKLSAVSVYEIQAGTVGGTPIGYLICSPLPQVVDPFFCLLHRPQFDAYSMLKEGGQGTHKYQLRSGLSIFTVEDDAVMFTYHTKSKITDALEGT